MKILSHRGYWKTSEEKNTLLAFERSFSLGFGTETDVRDLDGKLVISHDVPLSTNTPILFSDFLKCYKSFNNDLPLAINIKSDGLQLMLKQELEQFNISNYFVFDMSVPDTIGYLNSGLKVFGRESEYETKVSFYPNILGVWMDEFEGHWINENKVKEHLENGKLVCIVSPDLHKRNYLEEWADYKKIESQYLNYQENIWICTDFPEEARTFFYED